MISDGWEGDMLRNFDYRDVVVHGKSGRVTRVTGLPCSDFRLSGSNDSKSIEVSASITVDQFGTTTDNGTS